MDRWADGTGDGYRVVRDISGGRWVTKHNKEEQKSFFFHSRTSSIKKFKICSVMGGHPTSLETMYD